MPGDDQNERVEVVQTRGGAWAVRDCATGEVMHPVIGPRVEAESLYVAPSRLRGRLLEGCASDDPLVLLDVGLGAGSNAIAAWLVSESLPASARALTIVSFDISLDAMRLASSPLHASAFGFEGDTLTAARSLLEHGQATSGRARTRWRLVLGELPHTLVPEAAEASADIVFWDPFSPRANPALWNVTTFAALRRLCRDGATVHTYSCATRVRSSLLLAGFAVGLGEGTGEKGATTIAIAPAEAWEALARPLDRRWLERLGRSSAPWSDDAPQDALAHLARLPQFA